MDKVCHICPLWTQIKGKDPQSESEINRWDCGLAFLPMLLVENAQRQMQTVATIDALRREVQRVNDVNIVESMGRLNREYRRHMADELPSDGFSRLAPRKQDS
jgi:hypothetical protein